MSSIFFVYGTDMNWPTIEGFEENTLPKEICGVLADDMKWSDIESGRHAAVCMLFIPNGNLPAKIVLTKRTTVVRTHKGQVGFAGGRIDDGDESVAQTALRELSEELGVSGVVVDTHGVLEPIRSFRSGTLIYPVVVTANVALSDFTASEAEVDEIYSHPWTEFASEKSKPFRFNLFGCWRDSQLYNFEDCMVWGLTASMLAQAELK